MGRLVHAAAVLLAGGAACAAQAAELKVAHFMSPQHVMHRAVMAPLADAINAESNGDLTVKIFPAGELGAGPNQQYMRAVQGVADIAFGLHGYTSPQFPKTLMIELPGLADTPEEATGMLWNAFDEHLADEYQGVHVLGVWTNEPNILMMRDKPVRSLADLEGLKIRVPGAVMARTVEALGATPVAMPAPSMYNALQTGVVDGLLVGPCVIPAFKIGEVANHFTVGLPLGVTGFYLVMNQAAWDRLDAAQQELLAEHTGREMSLKAATAYGECGKRGIEMMREAEGKEVIELPPEEVAALEETLAEVRAEFIAEAEADGIPASEILSAMQAGQ